MPRMGRTQAPTQKTALELQVKVSASAGTMEIIEEVNDNKFRILINPSSTYIGLQIDGDAQSGSGCTGL